MNDVSVGPICCVFLFGLIVDGIEHCDGYVTLHD